MKKLKTNEDRLVKIAVQGRVASAVQYGDFSVSHEGRAYSCPSTGGIVYNVKVGDNAFRWAGDHIEPCVSAILDESSRGSRANMGFNFLACIGNQARLVSGEAHGARGVVTGHHGGVEHVHIDFDDRTLSRMTLDDRILIEGFGQGLELTDYPEIKVSSLDPRLLHKMPLKASQKGRLEAGVTHIIPAELMGAGLGHNNIGTGDIDIMTHDSRSVKKLRLDELRLGDLVAIQDHDHTFGRTFRRGAVTIGVVVHSNSALPGHGPGVSTLLASAGDALRPVIFRTANIGRLLRAGRYRDKR